MTFKDELCAICGSPVDEGTVTLVEADEDGKSVLIVRGVPARVCKGGHQWFSQETLRALERIWQGQQEAVGKEEATIYEFKPLRVA